MPETTSPEPAGGGWRPSGQCTQFVCDVASFGDERRSDDARMRVRKGLYDALRAAFTAEGIAWEECYAEDRGDGVLIIVPPQVDTALLLTSVPYRLRGEVRRHNAYSSEAVRIQLRVAVNTGEVHADEQGLVGTALNHAFRILDADPFKEALRASGADVALIVSSRVYDDVVRQGRGLLDPNDYRRIDIAVKELKGSAWVTLPGRGAPELGAGRKERPEDGRDGGGAMVPAGGDGPPAARGPGGAAGRNPADPDAPFGDGGFGNGAGQPAAGWPYGGGDVPSELLFELVDLAQAIPHLAVERGRDQVVAALPPEIAGAIPRSNNARSDIYAIIRTCLDYQDGLVVLVGVIGRFVGKSLPFQELHRAVRRLLYGE